MVETLKQVDLREYCVLEVLVVGEGCQVDLLYCHLLLRLPLHPLVYLTVHPLPQTFRRLVAVVTYHLYHHLRHLNDSQFNYTTNPNPNANKAVETAPMSYLGIKGARWRKGAEDRGKGWGWQFGGEMFDGCPINGDIIFLSGEIDVGSSESDG